MLLPPASFLPSLLSLDGSKRTRPLAYDPLPVPAAILLDCTRRKTESSV